MQFEIENSAIICYDDEGDKKFTIPYGVVTIQKSAFSDFNNLKKIIIPDSVVRIEESAFSGCTGLKSIIIPDSVRFIGSRAFENCINLKSIDIPESVEYIGEDAFAGTEWLEKKREKNPFVIVNSLLVDGKECSGNIIIPDNITKICDSAFEDCETIKSVIIPESVRSIGKGAFGGCKNLEFISIPKSVVNIGGLAFEGTKWLENRQKENPIVVVNGILVDGNKCVGDVIIPNNVEKIANEAFEYNIYFKSVLIPESVKHIGKYAFIEHSKLIFKYNEIELPVVLKWVWDSVEEENYLAEFFYNNAEKFKYFEQMKNTGYKIPCALLGFFGHGEQEYKQYIKENIINVAEYIIFSDDCRMLDIIFNTGFINSDNIDEIIEFAVRIEKTEMYIMLLHYKIENLGFANADDDFEI